MTKEILKAVEAEAERRWPQGEQVAWALFAQGAKYALQLQGEGWVSFLEDVKALIELYNQPGVDDIEVLNKANAVYKECNELLPPKPNN